MAPGRIPENAVILGRMSKLALSRATDGRVNAHVPGGRYCDAEIERGLHAVAICSGNTRRAARALKDQGFPVPRRTLQSWSTELHRDRYEVIQRDVLPQVYGRIAERSEDLAEHLADLEWKVADRLEESVAQMKPAEAASALRNVTVSKAVNVDKASLIRGRPSEIKVELGVQELVHAIGSELSDVLPAIRAGSIDSTAEEEPQGPPTEGRAG